MIEIREALASELRSILTETDNIRDRARTEVVEEREWLERSLARIETATRRLLQLLVG